MSETEPQLTAKRTTERGLARRWRYVFIGAAVLGAIANLARIRQPGLLLPLSIVAIGIALAVALRAAARQKKQLRSFESREALSDFISQQPKPLTRFNWVWIEYALARNVERGTYDDEPPIEYMDDATYLTQGLARKTRFNARVFLGAAAIGVAIFLVMGAWIYSSGLVSLWFPAILVFGTIALFSVQFRLLVGSRSDPLRSIARRVEDSVMLPGSERWDELVRIAHDERLLERS